MLQKQGNSTVEEPGQELQVGDVHGGGGRVIIMLLAVLSARPGCSICTRHPATDSSFQVPTWLPFQMSVDQGIISAWSNCHTHSLNLCRRKSNSIKGLPFQPICTIPVDLFPHTHHCELIILLEHVKRHKLDEPGTSQASESVILKLKLIDSGQVSSRLHHDLTSKIVKWRNKSYFM